jgi:ankyrin repeat protein
VLLQHGANPNIMDPEGFTPLYMAAASRSPECVSVLLKHGADPNCITRHGSALHVAGCPQTVDMLLAAGADVDAVDESGLTALGNAVFKGSAGITTELLAAGANVNKADK